MPPKRAAVAEPLPTRRPSARIAASAAKRGASDEAEDEAPAPKRMRSSRPEQPLAADQKTAKSATAKALPKNTKPATKQVGAKKAPPKKTAPKTTATAKAKAPALSTKTAEVDNKQSAQQNATKANTSAKRKASDDVPAPAAKKQRTTTTVPSKTTTRKTTAAKKATRKTPAAKTTTRKTPAVKTITRKSSASETATRKLPTAKATIPKATSTANRKTQSMTIPLNAAPTETLDVYVCGEGDSGELGLGTDKRGKGVKRPRLNHLLDAEKVGVVQIATGGMHAVALTHDNKILTWGVNDQGACGRDTKWEGGLRDIDAQENDSDSDSDDDDNGLNPMEATPTAIPSESFPADVKFVAVAAGDSASFALTDNGQVYGWGTFRDNNGILGFSKEVLEQRTPVLIKGLKNIKQLACGANHVLALDNKGSVFAWGTGQQNQLGRRVVERTRVGALVPREFGLPKKQIKYVSCGADHSFAVDSKNNVWSWGLNNYGQCGIPDNAGEDDAVVPVPQKVANLKNYTMTCLEGGLHHSIGVSDKGDCLVWGRADSSQMGIKLSDLPSDDIMKDEHDQVRILKIPTQVPGVDAEFATADSDYCIVITPSGQAYSWGFSPTYQTGQGTVEPVPIATLIDNSAVRGKKLNWAGAGGQYAVLTAVKLTQDQQPNGVLNRTEPVTITSKNIESTKSNDKVAESNTNAANMSGSSKVTNSTSKNTATTKESITSNNKYVTNSNNDTIIHSDSEKNINPESDHIAKFPSIKQ